MGLRAWRKWITVVYIMNMLCNSIILAQDEQRTFEEEEQEAVLVRKDRQSNVAGYNSFVNLVNLFLTGFYVTPTTTSNNGTNCTTNSITITPEFWTTFFNILQYLTFFMWFVMIMLFYVGGVLVLFIFAIVSPASTDRISNNIFNGALFRSFEDENMPLFDKVTSVGYGFLDRSGELVSTFQNPACSRYTMCHLSATLGDQEANGFAFKDMFRSLSATMDNSLGTDGMTRSVNVGLLTGECDEPIMNCPELAPYFKRISETWSSYL